MDNFEHIYTEVANDIRKILEDDSKNTQEKLFYLHTYRVLTEEYFKALNDFIQGNLELGSKEGETTNE